MTQDAPDYGLWTLVISNAAIFLMFTFSFFKLHTGRDWHTFGAFAAFNIALFDGDVIGHYVNRSPHL